MADEDVARLIVAIEAKLTAYDKSLAKMSANMDGAMKKVVASVDKGMRTVDATSAQAGMKMQANMARSMAGMRSELMNGVSNLTRQTGVLGSAFASMGAAGTAAAVGLGALVVVFGLLYGKGKEALQAADDIGDAAAKLGTTAEGLQEFRAIFTGLVDPATVDAGIGKLTTNIGLASAGVPKAKKVFEALHIELRDGANEIKTPMAVYLELADRIAALKSPAQQAAAAQKALGDSGKEQLPILRQGSAAIKEMIERYRAMGAIIPEEVITKAGELQQKLDDLSLVMKAQLTTALVDAGPEIVNLAQLLAANLPTAIRLATMAVKFLADNLKPLMAIFGGLAGAQLGAFIGSVVPGVGTGIGAIVGALAGGTAAWVGFGAAADAAGGLALGSADDIGGAAGRISTAEQGHIDTLSTLRDIYDELKTASGDRVKALEAEQKAIIDKAAADELAQAKAKLAVAVKARDEASSKASGSVILDPTGYQFAATSLNAKSAQDDVDKLTAKVAELEAAAKGTEHIFDPAVDGLDELVKHLGDISGEQITELQAAMVSANPDVAALVDVIKTAPPEITALSERYIELRDQLADVTGWDVAGQQMIGLIQGIHDINAELAQGEISADQAAAKYKHLLDMFDIPVSAQPIIDEINRVNATLQTLREKASTAFATLGEKLGSALRRFALGGGGEVVPGNAGKPRARPAPPPPKRTGGGGGELGDFGGGGGGGGGGKKAPKVPKDPALQTYLAGLKTEVDNLRLSGVALKENQLMTEAATKAKADFDGKVRNAAGALRESAALTIDEKNNIKALAAEMVGVPAILAIAKDKLPDFNLKSQIADLNELQRLIQNPEIAKSLEAQGLSAVDAGKAIKAQIASVTDEATGTSAAIQGIGEALVSGIQSATDFEDAILKIGIALGQMIAQAVLFGQGPLGKATDGWMGVVGGLVGGLAGASTGGGLDTAGLDALVASIPSNATGGNLRKGQASWINEAGQEAARRGQDLFIPGSATQIIPAAATARMMGGVANANGPMTIVVTGATGNQEVRQMIAAGVMQGMKATTQTIPKVQQNYQLRFG